MSREKLRQKVAFFPYLLINFRHPKNKLIRVPGWFCNKIWTKLFGTQGKLEFIELIISKIESMIYTKILEQFKVIVLVKAL